jgi:hypothetical protein
MWDHFLCQGRVKGPSVQKPPSKLKATA